MKLEYEPELRTLTPEEVLPPAVVPHYRQWMKALAHYNRVKTKFDIEMRRFSTMGLLSKLSGVAFEGAAVAMSERVTIANIQLDLAHIRLESAFRDHMPATDPLTVANLELTQTLLDKARNTPPFISPAPPLDYWSTAESRAQSEAQRRAQKDHEKTPPDHE